MVDNNWRTFFGGFFTFSFGLPSLSVVHFLPSPPGPGANFTSPPPSAGGLNKSFTVSLFDFAGLFFGRGIPEPMMYVPSCGCLAKRPASTSLFSAMNNCFPVKLVAGSLPRSHTSMSTKAAPLSCFIASKLSARCCTCGCPSCLIICCSIFSIGVILMNSFFSASAGSSWSSWKLASPLNSVPVAVVEMGTGAELGSRALVLLGGAPSVCICGRNSSFFTPSCSPWWLRQLA